MSNYHFVICHKEVEYRMPYVQYISARKVNGCLCVNKGLDDRLWSELSVVPYILSIISEGDWVCLNHYRRLTPAYNCNIVGFATPIRFDIRSQYDACHRLSDYLLCGKIIARDFPQIYLYWKLISEGSVQDFRPYNILNLPYNLFKEWASMQLAVLSKVLEELHIERYEDALKSIITSKVCENKIGINRDPSYQARIVSFLSERLTTAYCLYLIGKGVVAENMNVYTVPIYF